MSFALSVDVNSWDAHPQDVAAKILDKYENSQSPNMRINGVDREVYKTVETIAQSVMFLIDETLGVNWETVQVQIVGHHNKNNKKDPSWGNDFITLSLTVKEYSPVDDETEEE